MKNKPVWFPNEEESKNTRLYKMMMNLGYKDYDTFYQKSIEDVAWFWDNAVKSIDIKWLHPYDEVLQTSEDWKYPKWFLNGKMNVVENALEKWATDIHTQNNNALIWESDNGKSKTYTYLSLQKEVHAAAVGFLKNGMKQGDVATIYMPMIPETVISMLALAKIGVIFSPVFSGYGADAIATRLNASSSKYLLTADGYYRRGKRIEMKKEVDAALLQCSTIQKVIVVNHTSEPTPWNDQRDIDFHSLLTYNQAIETVQTNSDDPLMLIYTSGTTGKPKGAIHTHSGFPIKAAFDAGICMNVDKEDVFFWYSDMGWMMGPFLVFGGLLNGASILLFEGVPDYPTTDRIWQICSQHRVTHLGISPTFVRSIMTNHPTFIDQYDLSSLKAIGSTGEPWNPDPWLWLFKHVCKEKIPIFNYSGGTEISGGILGNVLLKPISPITFNSPIPGMSVDVYDSSGSSVENQVGELVITKPWVGMTAGFWKELDRYESAYWNVYPHTWVHGDWVIKDSDGFWTITGRSDDILNIAGKRIGPAEIESAIISHPNVIECASIGVPHPVKGECAVCFVVLNNNNPCEQFAEELLNLVAASLGKALKPEAIHFVNQLPKTRNGKVMRRVIKAAYLHTSIGDLSALENREAVKDIEGIRKKS
ncbi:MULTISPECIES: AMP-binding protein [Bacillus]|uniref:AMP-binding protein n=1 Tax=Bacillus TaxID=1386 RepID=UPI0002DCF785|nr:MULTISPECIES: AMP-binding protein [Bacillus]